MRKLLIFWLILIAGLVFGTVVYADEPSGGTSETSGQSDELKVCDIQPQQIESMATQAESALIALNKAVNKLNNEAKEFDSHWFGADGACAHVQGWFDGWLTKQFSWTSKDKAGAKMDPDNKHNLDSLMDSVDFSNTDLDLPKYVTENKKLLSNAQKQLDFAQKENNTTAIKEYTSEVQKYQTCQVSLENMLSTRNEAKKNYETAHQFLAALSGQDVVCQCAADGTVKNCVVADSDHVEEDVDSLMCKTLPEYVEIFRVCPTCPIFEKVLVADQKLAEGAYGKLAESLIKLLAIGFMLYLGVQTLTAVGSPEPQTLSKYLTTVSIQAFKVLVAVQLLMNGSFVYSTLLSPIIQGGIDFGITLTQGSQNQIIAHGEKYNKFTNSELLSPELMKTVMGAAESFNEQAAEMPAIGWALVCNAFVNLTDHFMPHLEMLIEGAIVLVFGVMISLSVGFYLLDVSLELGIVCCLIPFLIACWPFKITVQYTKVGWQFILHMFFNFVMIGVVISVISELTKMALSSGMDKGELETYINTGQVEELVQKMNLGGLAILIVLVCCCISLKLLKDIDSLTNKLAPGAGISLSPQVAADAVQVAKATAMAGARIAGKYIGAATGVTAVAEVTGLDKKFKQMKNKVKGAANKVRNKAGSTIGIGSKAKNSGARSGSNSGSSFS